MSFDRMRSMLMRAAEIRDSEQQQIFDSLDEIHARLATLDALGSMRKRLAELPDRTEVSVLAERLDETVAKLDAQDASIASVARGVDALVDRLAKPFAQLDGRLDGVAGRMEGVVGRMDGLDDKLGGLHKRLDDLDNRLDRHELRLDGLPGAITSPVKERVGDAETALRGRLDELDEEFRQQLDGARDEARKNGDELRRTTQQTGDELRTLISENGAGVQNLIGETGTELHTFIGDTGTGLSGKLDALAERPAVDPTDQLTTLANRLDSLADRLEEVTKRLDTLDKTLDNRPDKDSLSTLVRQANQESERRNAGQLDEAMATFAELILGRGPGGHPPQMPMPAPRPAQRRSRAKASVKARNGTTPDDPSDDGDD
ncbi:PA containing protein [Pseudonocardia acaciae]|uniref:PA containing protein n=1 Tax=Pseudonocardia acaciae TaxID=551276 RepID=UPI0005648A9E